LLKEASGMIALQTITTIALLWLVCDRGSIRHKSQSKPRRITSIQHLHDGVEYVARADPHDDGVGEVLKIWSSSGRSSFLTPLGGAR
jgi:hypothetical protein